MPNYLFMVRAEFESWPKHTASHDHALLGHVVSEAKPAINTDGTDCKEVIDPKAEQKLILSFMLHEPDLDS